jgi:cobalt-zinc-cadmium efflux system outer membrane protein
VALVAIPLLAAPACRSLSNEPDLRQAADRLESRVGFAPEWAPDEPRASDPEEPTRPLSVRESMRVAVQRHPVVREKLAELAERRADLVQADRFPNPLLTLSFGFPIDGEGGSPAMHGIRQSLSALWTRPTRVAAAEAELRAAVLSLCDVSVALAASVGRSLAEVHHRERQAGHSSREVLRLEERVELLRTIEAAGEAPRGVVNAARRELAAARRREIDDRERSAAAKRTLFERLGASALDAAALGSDLRVDASTLPALDAVPPSEEEVIELVVSQRLDVLAAFAALEGSEARVRSAARSRWPEMTIGVDYYRNFSERESVGPAVGLEIPIFDTGRAALAKAEAIESRTLAAADRILTEAILEARLAHVALVEARERRTRLEVDWLEPLRDDHRIVLEAFEAGEASRVEVLRREAELLEAERRLDDAALAIRVAHYELWRAAGGSLARIDDDPAVDAARGTEARP